MLKKIKSFFFKDCTKCPDHSEKKDLTEYYEGYCYNCKKYVCFELYKGWADITRCLCCKSEEIKEKYNPKFYLGSVL